MFVFKATSSSKRATRLEKSYVMCTDKKGLNRAQLSFLGLIEQLETSNRKRLKSLAKTLKRWRGPVLVYFRLKVTIGSTEAINAQA